MLLTTLAFYMRINPFSGKKTPSSNNSYKVRAFLNSKRRKRKITEAKRIVMLIKQIKKKPE